MHYTVRIRQKKNGQVGAKHGELGRYTRKADAMRQAQQLADSGMVKRGMQVTVERVGSRKNPKPSKRKRAVKKRRNARSRTRTYMGHKITGKTGNYVVKPYNRKFRTLSAAKAWLKGHIRRIKR